MHSRIKNKCREKKMRAVIYINTAKGKDSPKNIFFLESSCLDETLQDFFAKVILHFISKKKHSAELESSFWSSEI